MALLTKIRNRNVFHLIERTFNRIVPPWIFRFSVGDVLELDLAKLCDAANNLDSGDFRCRGVESSDEREQLRSVTWNSVPLCSSENDFGYGICQEGDPQKFIGGVWGGIESFAEVDLGFQIRLEPDQAWIYCAFVSKNARGGGVYRRVLSFAANDLKRRGYHRLRVVIQPWNKASISVHARYSVGRIGRITVVRVFGLAAVFCAGRLTKSKTFTTDLVANPVVIELP